MLESENESQNQEQLNKKPTQPESQKKSLSIYKAFAMAVVANMCLVLMQANLKRLSKVFNPPLIISIRGSLLFIFTFLYLYYKKIPIHSRDKTIYRSIIKRATTSSLTVILYLTSVKYIPMGIANALFNTSPILTFFIEAFYYKKNKFHVANFIITVISFIGVLFIIQPQFLFHNNIQTNQQQNNYIFYFVVLFSAITGSFSMIFLHDLRGRVDELVVLEHGYFIQNCMSMLFYLMTVTPAESQKTIDYLSAITLIQSLKLVLNVGLFLLFSFLLQYLTAKAMYLCTPAFIMPFNYVSVIFGVFLDYFFYDAQYNGLMIIGMLMSSGGLFSKFVLAYFQKK